MIEQASNAVPNGGDIPVWWAFLVALAAAVSGETYRGDKAHLSAKEIARRVFLRSAAAAILGVATLWGALAVGLTVLGAGAIASVVSLAGADIGLALYLAWFRSRLGINKDE